MPRMTRPKRSTSTAPLALVLLSLAAPAAAVAQAKPAAAGGQFAVLETSRGKIGIRLLPQKAPKAVENFVGLATGKKAWTDPATGKKSNAPLYDGTLFHRVIPGFMIQGGDPLSRGAAIGKAMADNGRPFGTGDPGFRFPDELEAAGATPFATPCQLAMANSGPNTNGSQFFVTEVPTPHLNPRPCPTGVCGYVHLGEGVCGCNLVADIAHAGNGQTKLVKVTVQSEPPTCK
jgi:peptidylprolyl isomerase/peptidyl-prolyl cis-trans isomerase A (cyclophilin A)